MHRGVAGAAGDRHPYAYQFPFEVSPSQRPYSQIAALLDDTQANSGRSAAPWGIVCTP